MTLLIDAGNSRIKWATLLNDKLSKQSARPYTDNAIGICQQLFQLQAIRHVVLVHVLGAQFEKEIKAIARSFSIDLLIVHSKLQAYDIKTNYIKPDTLGADRFVAMVAARHLYMQKNCIVIDCGTAVTIDAIDKQGNHIGGVILAGLQLCEESLIGKAKNLNQLKQELETAKTDVFSIATAQGVKTGCQYSVVAAIEQVCRVMEEKLITSLSVQKLICGGDAKKIHAMLQEDFTLHDDLVIQGLRFIAGFNS